MSTLDKAIVEFDILEKTVEDPIVLPFKEEILALVKKFGESGQSGGSAPYTASAISLAVKELCLQNTICPITCEHDEFNDVSSYGGDGSITFQNKRLSSVFKEGEKGEPYYINGISKKVPDGTCWSGGFWITREDYLTGDKGLRISNRAFIKELPFKPKTFYIDVIEEEVAPDDWEMWVKDISQLKEALEMYDLKRNNGKKLEL